MSNTITPEEAVRKLERIAYMAGSHEPMANQFQQAEVQAEVLSAFAAYKVQEGTLVAMKEASVTNITLHNSTIQTLQWQAKEMEKQARYTKWLAVATLFVGLATFVSAILR